MQEENRPPPQEPSLRADPQEEGTETPSASNVTPMMEQWHLCKKEAKGALLLFRMGDFYEAFYEDATALSHSLSLTLTQRQGIPMAGIPWHTHEGYVDRLIAKGYRVAIAEQLGDPHTSKGLMKREIVRIVTPGTILNPTETENNFIVAIDQVGASFGMAILDLTTASFRVVECEDIRDILNELYRLCPAEVVALEKFYKKYGPSLRDMKRSLLSTAAPWQFEHQAASSFLSRHFKISHLDSFGLKGMVAAINAAGGLLSYIQDDLSLSLSHIRTLVPFTLHETLLLDPVSLRNLEVTESLSIDASAHSLLTILDKTATPMGKRLLRQWIKQPLLNLSAIEARLDRVDWFFHRPLVRTRLLPLLRAVRDLERLMMRIVSGYASPRDLLALGLSLAQIPLIQEVLTSNGKEEELGLEPLISLSPLAEKLTQALCEEPPLRLTEGEIFRTGYHAELDALRTLSQSKKAWLASYQHSLREETGIKTLKVSFNKIFGYYLEVSKGQAHLMPPAFHKKQTLVNTERFISPLLKEYETKILSAEEERLALEKELFLSLCKEVATYEKAVCFNAQVLARLDIALSLATVAHDHHYCRPLLDQSHLLDLQGARHPIVEAVHTDTFIPNDLYLDDAERVMVITGPNMAGKSTYMRQTALIVLMAQMGSFVPCTRAHIGIVEKIFTRIGASDDLSRGQSTFMVEMSETANILHNLSSRSLILLDEVGRGTSTQDGLAIAWSVVEFLLKSGAKTLFATHYGELTELEKWESGVVNYHATVAETSNDILFLHKIARGSTNQSYGIHVAQLAGLPLSVIKRAYTLLNKFESSKNSAKRAKKEERENEQLTLF